MEMQWYIRLTISYTYERKLLQKFLLFPNSPASKAFANLRRSPFLKPVFQPIQCDLTVAETKHDRHDKRDRRDDDERESRHHSRPSDKHRQKRRTTITPASP